MVKRKQKELFPHPVISVDEIAPGVYDLRTERKFDFVPGQVVAVAVSPHDEPRLYSLASGSDQPWMRLLFDVNPAGLLTPLMAAMHTGDQLWISEPFGRFKATHDPAWWIATGTGIAPFVSMAESGYNTGITLLHGARTPENFYFSNVFEEAPGIEYLRFGTRKQGPGIQPGRLTEHLRQLTILPTDILYYLCGNAGMVVEVRDLLVSKGVPFSQIMAEIYF